MHKKTRTGMAGVPVVVALSVMLGGCFVMRVAPQKPELPLPDALPVQPQATTQLPDPWWTIFGDSQLDSLVDEALEHNPDVAIAAARVAETRSALRITNADRLPSLNLEGDATRSRISAFQFQAPGVERERTLYTVQGAAAFEIDLWGRYLHASQSARERLLASEFNRETIKLSLTGEVVRGYFGLIAAAEQLARARDTLTTRDESLQLERLRLDAGESDEFTFKRAEAEAAATRVAVHQLEREVVGRTNALGILLGRSPQDLVDRVVTVQGVSLPGPATLPPELPSSVMERRPDIGAAEAALNEAAADIGVARALLFPSISLTGLFGSVSPQLDALFTKPAEQWTASGSILQPIFQGGRLRANVARAQAVRTQRQAEYSRTVQNAFREVLDALQGQQLISNARDANADQVAALMRATELAELRYTQGDIAYLELLDVRRALYQAQIDLVAVQRDALLNTVDLSLAVGGGLGERAGPITAHR